MERRFLPRVHDRGNRKDGTFCTRWEGWKKYPPNTQIRFVHCGQPRRLTNRARVRCVENTPGVYAILYYPAFNGDSKPYVLYIGSTGKDLHTEAKQTIKRFADHWAQGKTGLAFASVISTKQAHDLEYFLMRYYTPPWNTAFRKAPRAKR